MPQAGKLLIICGPTATGKTALALHLAKKYNGELISADSRQVYKGMDIGTGKDLDEKVFGNDSVLVQLKNKTLTLAPYVVNGISLWLYDIIEPTHEFSVSHYAQCARAVIHHIHQKGKLAILVGGTGLYIQAVRDGIDTIDIPPDASLRQELSKAHISDVQAMLRDVDPTTFARLNNSDKNNLRRLVRKIEIAKNNGIISKSSVDYDSMSIGLTVDTQELFDRIDKRVDARIDQGMQKEIESLIAHGVSWDTQAMNTFGYKEWRPFFEKVCSLEQVIQTWRYDEHGYARRQLTWFKKDDSIVWFDCAQESLQGLVEQKIDTWYT